MSKTEREDKVKYLLFKDYNGRAYRFRTLNEQREAERMARRIVAKENCGERLTCRVYKQVYFHRSKKVQKRRSSRKQIKKES